MLPIEAGHPRREVLGCQLGPQALQLGLGRLAFDGSGTLWFAEKTGNAVHKVTADGTVTTVAGGSVGEADGTGTAAQFRNPRTIVADGQGNFLVSDLFNRRLRRVTAAGVVTTLKSEISLYAMAVHDGKLYATGLNENFVKFFPLP